MSSCKLLYSGIQSIPHPTIRRVDLHIWLFLLSKHNKLVRSNNFAKPENRMKCLLAVLRSKYAHSPLTHKPQLVLPAARHTQKIIAPSRLPRPISRPTLLLGATHSSLPRLFSFISPLLWTEKGRARTREWLRVDQTQRLCALCLRTSSPCVWRAVKE